MCLITALLYAKKFRDHGYKTGALDAFWQLEEAELGKAEQERSGTGASVRLDWVQYYKALVTYLLCCQNTIFTKTPIPDSAEDKTELAKKLQPFQVSLSEYCSAMKLAPITWV
jgi:hypothetical protein